MNELVKYQTDDYGIIYNYLDFFISVPNNIQNNIKLRLSFEKDQTELVNSMNKYRTKDDNVLFLSVTNDINNNDFIDELTKIKKIVNDIYNLILKEKHLTKNNFIKKIELIDNGNNPEFVKWLCEYYPNRFYKSEKEHQDLFSNKEFIFNTPLTDSVNSVPVVNSSYTPTKEKISIGELDPIYKENINTNTKINKLNNNAFIKLPMIMLMLIVISITALIITLVLLK